MGGETNWNGATETAGMPKHPLRLYKSDLRLECLPCLHMLMYLGRSLLPEHLG